MYITWETLFLFCTLIVAIISLVIDILNKKDSKSFIIFIVALRWAISKPVFSLAISKSSGWQLAYPQKLLLPLIIVQVAIFFSSSQLNSGELFTLSSPYSLILYIL